MEENKLIRITRYTGFKTFQDAYNKSIELKNKGAVITGFGWNKYFLHFFDVK